MKTNPTTNSSSQRDTGTRPCKKPDNFRAVDGDRVGRAAVRGDRLLERRHGRALREEVGAEHVDDRLDVGVRDVLAAVGDHA